MLRSSLILMLAVLAIGASGCFQRRGRSRSEAVTQAIAEKKTKTDNLRKAMRYLSQVNQVNRRETTKEVQLELNTWVKTVDSTRADYSPSPLLRPLPMEMLAEVGCESSIALQFSPWDVDYLYECRLLNKLSDWVCDFPLRDSLVLAAVESKAQDLSEAESLKLMDACKLFDWTMRNIALEPGGASVEELLDDPAGPIADDGIGYGYLPWETLLFSFGDVIERGRVFTSLARQRGIPTAWISINPVGGGSEKIWAIAAAIGSEVYVFEPKLSMPVLNPDTRGFATLSETVENSRVLRRLDLPGQFDYALNPGELKSYELLLDIPPTAASARMKMLESALLSDERMALFQDLNALEQVFAKVAPGVKVRLWEIPLMSQLQAKSVRERLKSITPFTLQYTARHGVWMMDNAAANGRFQHLFGAFENEDDEKGALSLYMDTRRNLDDESIARLAYDPDVQKQLGVAKNPTETMEQYGQKVAQYQYLFRKAKIDASFLMAQLHLDRGNYKAAEKWFVDRVLSSENPMAVEWQAISHFGLARIYQEQGDLEKLTEHLSYQPSPIEAGSRLRLRYLKAMLGE